MTARAVLCGLMLAVAAPIRADEIPVVLVREVHAFRLTSPVAIDGMLTEPVWQQAEPSEGFVQGDPIEGGPPSQRTEVRVAYDDDALYIGARLYDTAPDSIVALLARRDVAAASDRFYVFLDPYFDRRSGYYFMVNAAGTQYDGTLFNDDWDDSSWDGVWEGKPHRDERGWTLEMRIPYSQLRFQKAPEFRWGINFRRSIPRRNEEDYLVFRPRKESGFVSRFPALTGMENLNPGRALEVLPYVTTQAEYRRPAPLDPFHDGSRYTPAGGGDLRMPVGSRLTLNATANPDFGQVEVDPAVVNLSDYESFFEEKRPFFVENASVFGCGNEGANDYWNFNWQDPKFFYTRRIGRAPQRGIDPGISFADVPRATRILGAAKVTGKVAPGWNFGTLHAVTANETGQFAVGSTRWKSDVEPLAYYGVVRSLKEFKERRHGLGFMSTVSERSFRQDTLRDQLSRSTFMTAVDGWHFLDRDQVWVLSGWSAVSSIQGTRARITALQQDPRHYFQRPDAGYVDVDPNATSLSGWGTRLWLNKQKGKTFGNFALGAISPGFDNNEMGFLRQADLINGHAGYGYRWTEPNAWRKQSYVLGALFSSFDFGGNRTISGALVKHYIQFASNWEWVAQGAYYPRSLNDRLTRGGPLVANEPAVELQTDGVSSPNGRVTWYFDGYSYTQREADSWNWNADFGVEWHPASSVVLSFGPYFERVHDHSHYLATVPDPTATATFGNRYVLPTLDQTTLSATIRLNWAFTPHVSFQFYGQPLVSTGRYTDFKELALPRTYEFIGAGAGPWTYDAASGTFDLDGLGPAGAFGPDFNFKSLRGNAVFRWEYLPGSAFYLVWTQERTDDDVSDGFAIGPSFRRLVTAEANNIFLAKVTYYLNM